MILQEPGLPREAAVPERCTMLHEPVVPREPTVPRERTPLHGPTVFGKPMVLHRATRPTGTSVLPGVPALLSILLMLFAVGCGGGGTDERSGAPQDPPGSDGSPAEAGASEVVRTADPARRGLSEADFPRVQEVAEGVYTYEALRSAGDERFTTVSLFVVTSEGVLVADGQGSEEETRRLLDAIAAVTDQPVTHLVIGSDHGDHTGGNTAFPDHVEVLAHPTSAAVLEAAASRGAATRNAEDRNAEDRSAEDRSAASPDAGVLTETDDAGERVFPADPPRALTATRLVEDEVILRLGGREIRVLFLGRAHTGGDLSVHLPREKVLFMSEAYLNRVFPAMRSAHPSEWVAMIERAQALDVDVYVPGHGFVEAPEVLEEELEAYRQALETVIAEAGRLHALGLTAEEAAERADFGELETWSLRESQGGRAIQRVFMELDGELPAG